MPNENEPARRGFVRRSDDSISALVEPRVVGCFGSLVYAFDGDMLVIVHRCRPGGWR